MFSLASVAILLLVIGLGTILVAAGRLGAAIPRETTSLRLQGESPAVTVLVSPKITAPALDQPWKRWLAEEMEGESGPADRPWLDWKPNMEDPGDKPWLHWGGGDGTYERNVTTEMMGTYPVVRRDQLDQFE